jgi:glycopeptide antibiotics resistance protein
MGSDRKLTPTTTYYLWLAHALLVLSVYGSLIPFRYQPMPLDEALIRFQGLRYFDPSLVYARGDWMVNSVQFAIMSFCYLGGLCVGRRLVFGMLVALVLVPIGGLVAVLLEFVQVYFPPRTVSLNDLVVEWTGIVVGAGIWLLVGQRATDWLRRSWSRKGLAGLATQALPAYILLLLVVHLMPFDFIVGRDELARKYNEGRIQLLPFGDLPAGGITAVVGQLTNVAAFIPLGALVSLIPRWSGLGWPAMLGLGLGATITVEVLQFCVYTRQCDVTDVLTGTAAMLLGWWLVGAVRNAFHAGLHGLGDVRRTRWVGSRGALGGWATIVWWGVFGVWVGVLVFANWQPFHFTTVATEFQGSDPALTDESTLLLGLRRMAFAPLVDYYWGSRYNALDQFVKRSLSFVPLGVMVALGPGRRERLGVGVTVLVALVLGVMIETGQYFIPERHPSTTDVLIQVLGAWLGFALTRHVVHALEPDIEAHGVARYAYRAGIGATAVGSVGESGTRSEPGMRKDRSPTGTKAGSGGGRPKAGRFGLVASAILSTQRLGERIDALLAWLDTQPYVVPVAIICAAAVVLALGFAMLVNILGWV